MEITKDAFGPEYVVRVYDPAVKMEGFLVVDNTALGPGKGGIRMTAGVSAGEVWRLARTMTWKNALAGIPFGGAKAGIVWPSSARASAGKKGGNDQLKKKFIQSFARRIKLFTPRKYIAGPDVGTGEKEMQWFVEATGNWRSATGKPANLCMKLFGASTRLSTNPERSRRVGKPGEKPRSTSGARLRGRCGIPHEFGSTGFGVAQATKIAAEFLVLEITEAKVAIHGFGNVGTFTYQFLREMGAKIVALADSTAAVFDSRGLDDKILEKIIKQRKTLASYPSRFRLKTEKFWKIPVDILIPASVTDVINERNKDAIRAKIIVEAANIPMRENIEEELFRRGILIVPDFVANAGGVISSYAEYRGYNPRRMFELVARKISAATNLVLEKSQASRKHPRRVALELAQAKVKAKMSHASYSFPS